MKLFFSGTSPFARKVMVCATVRGIKDKIEKIGSNPWESPDDLVQHNPLSKIPCLIADDGTALIESPVICEYLDTLGDAPKLVPAAGAARQKALKLQALADGITSAGIIRRMEEARPEEAERAKVIARQKAIMARGLAALDAEPPSDTFDIGSIAVGCCLGWIDFRNGTFWQAEHPNLAAWWNKFSQQDAMQQTAPR